MARRGLLAPNQVRTCTADALVNIDAFVSTLPLHVVQRLGLFIIRKARVEHADGSQETVDVTEQAGIVVNGRRTVGETLVIGDEVVIGRRVLAELDLVVDHFNNQVIGNPAHPDQPVFRV